MVDGLEKSIYTNRWTNAMSYLTIIITSLNIASPGMAVCCGKGGWRNGQAN